MVKGLVGPVDQAFEGIVVLILGKANGDCHGKRQGLAQVMLHRMPYPLGKEARAMFFGRPQQDDEFFAAPADHRVIGPALLLKTAADRLQGEVAEMVAVGIVDSFEMVDIQKEHGHGFVPPEAAGAFVVEDVSEITAVFHTGKRIEGRLGLKLLDHLVYLCIFVIPYCAEDTKDQAEQQRVGQEKPLQR